MLVSFPVAGILEPVSPGAGRMPPVPLGALLELETEELEATPYAPLYLTRY